MDIMTQDMQVVEVTDADIKAHVLRVDEQTRRDLIARWEHEGYLMFWQQKSIDACRNQYQRAGYRDAMRNADWAEFWAEADARHQDAVDDEYQQRGL